MKFTEMDKSNIAVILRMETIVVTSVLDREYIYIIIYII